MELIKDLIPALVDCGFSSSQAEFVSLVVVAFALVIMALIFYCLIFALVYTLLHLFPNHYYLILFDNGEFTIRNGFRLSKRYLRKLVKQHGDICVIERFTNKELLYLSLQQDKFNVGGSYFGKDYKVIMTSIINSKGD